MRIAKIRLTTARYIGIMSNIDASYAPPHDRKNAVLSGANGQICAFILLFFIVVAAFCAMRKDVRLGFDEVAHVSYIAHLQHRGGAWPHLEDMRMLEPSSFHFTDDANYLNHPSPYYVLMAHLGPTLEGHPGALIVFRLINILLAAVGFAALMAIGFVARLSRIALYAYIVPIACIPVLMGLAGSVNNDNAAFAGGGIAALAVWQLIATGSRAAILAALGGAIVASWAKLTGLLLVGGMIGVVLMWLLWRGRFQTGWIAPIAIAVFLAAAPYIAFIVHYGNPTPNTSAQIAMLQTGAHAVGWDIAERLSPAAYAAYFVSEFILEWMPFHTVQRDTLNYAALVIPIATVLCAFVGFVVSARRIARRHEGPIDVVVVAGVIAFAATFMIHGVFSYERHVAYGWMLDAYPRYYLPLAVLVPLAGVSLLGAIKQPRIRPLLAGFLIFGPVFFRLLGTPLGLLAPLSG